MGDVLSCGTVGARCALAVSLAATLLVGGCGAAIDGAQTPIGTGPLLFHCDTFLRVRARDAEEATSTCLSFRIAQHETVRGGETCRCYTGVLGNEPAPTPSPDDAPISRRAADRDVGLAALTAGCTLAPGTTVTAFVGIEGDVLRVQGGDACAERVLRAQRFEHRSDLERVVLTIPASSAPP